MTSDADFARAVEEGLRLAKRIEYAKPPPPAAPMAAGASADFAPSAPMLYAVITDPMAVENPDIPSYQPYVYGALEPPALIPLQMNEIGVEVDCLLDSAVVAVWGCWNLHCVSRSRRVDCRLVVPMGEQGSILGVEIEVDRKTYSTRVIKPTEDLNMEMIAKNEGGGFLKPQLFSLTFPQVTGGSDISISVMWCQKLTYKGGEFFITIPFTFPDFIISRVKMFRKRERIQLNVNTGTGKEVILQRTSHALKEKVRKAGNLSFLYEADVASWSTTDFFFSYTVYSSEIFGGVLLQSPLMHDSDQRDMVCIYLFPGTNEKKKTFKREVIFLVDISGSMQGKPIDKVRSALLTTLSDLKPGDYFNIIAFNDEMHLFSSHLEPATEYMIANANKWIDTNLIASGGTDITSSLNKAIDLLSSTQDSIQHVFLITDGAVDNERKICHDMKSYFENRGPFSPRVSAFGIGSFCNHYFLRMLASLGRGHYDAAYDSDSIEIRLQGWFDRVSSPIMTNINISSFDTLDEFQVYPSPIPDLSVRHPLIISGRYQGKFPDSFSAKGILADKSDVAIELKVQHTKDYPLEQAFAKDLIDLLTAQAWFSESKQLEGKVAKLSVQTSIPSEYTAMVLLRTDLEKEVEKQMKIDNRKKRSSAKEHFPILVRGLTMGFGNIAATTENLPAGFGEYKPPDPMDLYFNKAVGCCSRLADCCCCMCIIKVCSKLNDQCLIVLSQLCTALSCLGCIEGCSDLCCGG